MNPKFSIKKKYFKSHPGILTINKIKHLKIYKKINAIILEKSKLNYKIKISKDYAIFNVYKDDVYFVNYQLLKKCSKNV